MSTPNTPERYRDEGKRNRLYVIFNSDVDGSIDAFYPNIDVITPEPVIETVHPPQIDPVATDDVASIASALVHAELSQADQLRQTIEQIHENKAA